MKDTVEYHPTPASHEWLYGVDILYFEDFSYIGAIREKIRLARIQYTNVSLQFFEDTDRYEGWQIKEEWLKDISNAIEHNEKLLEEYNDRARTRESTYNY